jgi:hypothetical protein
VPMSEVLHGFVSPAGRTAVFLPFPLRDLVAGWSGLRAPMIRERPPAFTRDEWAYLVEFLDPSNLRRPFEAAFGTETDGPGGATRGLARPRGPIAVWLPGNVSLLGPLTLVLLSLTGNVLRLKGSSHTEDLTGSFLEFARSHLPAGPLRGHLEECVVFAVFERGDPRNSEMASSSKMRIVFGSDGAAEEIHALPHPLDSIAFSFTNRESEAWVEREAIDDALGAALLKVFAIYGQAGCTSPRRVVILGGAPDDARALRDRLARLWSSVIRRETPPHLASANVMTRQWAAAIGWDAVTTGRNAAVLASGAEDLQPLESPMALGIVSTSLKRAVDALPPNVQTVGHAVAHPEDPGWLGAIAGTAVKRFVPIARMHDFGPVWDGHGFWRQAFEEIEVGL